MSYTIMMQPACGARERFHGGAHEHRSHDRTTVLRGCNYAHKKQTATHLVLETKNFRGDAISSQHGCLKTNGSAYVELLIILLTPHIQEKVGLTEQT